MLPLVRLEQGGLAWSCGTETSIPESSVQQIATIVMVCYSLYHVRLIPRIKHPGRILNAKPAQASYGYDRPLASGYVPHNIWLSARMDCWSGTLLLRLVSDSLYT